MTQDEELPFPDAELMVFNNMIIGKDGMLLIKRNGGCLLACDSLQYYGDQKHHSLLASLRWPFMGFKGMCIGPPWLKAVTPEGSSLKPDFDRILRDWEFEKLFSAHGCYVEVEQKISCVMLLTRHLNDQSIIETIFPFMRFTYTM